MLGREPKDLYHIVDGRNKMLKAVSVAAQHAHILKVSQEYAEHKQKPKQPAPTHAPTGPAGGLQPEFISQTVFW